MVAFEIRDRILDPVMKARGPMRKVPDCQFGPQGTVSYFGPHSMTMVGEPSYGYVGSLLYCLIRAFCEPEPYGIRAQIIVRKYIDSEDL